MKSIEGETGSPLMGAEAPHLQRRSLVSFARDLAQARSIPRFHGKLSRQKVTEPAPRILYLSQVIRRCCFEWICRQGGYRDKSVFIKERRMTGRIWESPMWESLELKFTPLSLQILCNAFEHCAAQSQQLLIPDDEDASLGDTVFLHLVLERLLHGTEALEKFWEHSVGEGQTLHASLTRLYHPDRLPPKEPQLTRLQSPQYALLLSYLDRDIARCWAERDSKRAELRAPEGLPYYENFGDFLQSWLAGVEKSERYDQLLLIAEFFRRVLRQNGSREALIRKVKNKVVVDIYSASERQRFMQALGRIYKIGEDLDRIFDDCRSKAYVERSAADHLFLSGYHDIYRPVSEDVKVVGRQFLGEIG